MAPAPLSPVLAKFLGLGLEPRKQKGFQAAWVLKKPPGIEVSAPPTTVTESLKVFTVETGP